MCKIHPSFIKIKMKSVSSSSMNHGETRKKVLAVINGLNERVKIIIPLAEENWSVLNLSD